MSELSIGEKFAYCQKELEAGIWLLRSQRVIGNALPVKLELFEILQSVLSALWIERTKFPVSSTLDRLLDSRFDLAAEAEADLGEIEHNGEKVMVKIKVKRGEQPLSNTQQFKLNNQELLDRSINIVDELECGDASESMAEELRDTLTMLFGNQDEPRGEEEGEHMNTLRKGDTGDAVCYLQTLLNRRRSALSLSIDGIFGPQTEGAVKDFQSDSRLVVDGMVGIKTWTALSNEAPNVMPRNKFLSESDLIEAAKTLGVELAVMKAVAEVESHGAGFIPGTDKPKILFEGHWFWKRLKVYGIDPEKHVKGNEDILYKSWTKDFYLGGEREYDRLGRATLIHGEAGNESASWGMFQIMGYHWEALGYMSAYDFVDSMWKSEAEHLKAFVRYIQVNDLAKWMKAKNWEMFAFHYNGPSFSAHAYDKKMAEAYERYKS